MPLRRPKSSCVYGRIRSRCFFWPAQQMRPVTVKEKSRLWKNSFFWDDGIINHWELPSPIWDRLTEGRDGVVTPCVLWRRLSVLRNSTTPKKRLSANSSNTSNPTLLPRRDDLLLSDFTHFSLLIRSHP